MTIIHTPIDLFGYVTYNAYKRKRYWNSLIIKGAYACVFITAGGNVIKGEHNKTKKTMRYINVSSTKIIIAGIDSTRLNLLTD